MLMRIKNPVILDKFPINWKIPLHKKQQLLRFRLHQDCTMKLKFKHQHIY